MSNNKDTARITESLRKKLGPEGLAYLKANGELPPIKTTREEMEFLHGGQGGPVRKDILEALLGPLVNR